MFHTMRTLALSVLLVGLVWCQAGFAVDLPEGAVKDDALSGIALEKAQEVFAAQKAALQQYLATDTELPEDQKAFIESLLATAEQQLQTLGKMEIYFVEEAAPGEAYNTVVDFYQNKLNNFTNLGSEELAMMLDTPLVMPEETKTAFEAMINDGSARAAAGTSGGTSRVSIMTFYIHPGTLELIQKTTIVVATTK